MDSGVDAARVHVEKESVQVVGTAVFELESPREAASSEVTPLDPDLEAGVRPSSLAAPPAPASLAGPGPRMSLEEFRAQERLQLQRTLGVVGIVVLAVNAVGDYTDVEGHLKNTSMAFFHNLSAAAGIGLAMAASRWHRNPVCRHWYLFAVLASFVLYLAWLWPAPPWWDAHAILHDDRTDEPGPPLWMWATAVGGSSHWRLQAAFVALMYAYFVPLKYYALAPEYRGEIILSNAISLGMSSLIALATGYLREREVMQRYQALHGGRLKRTGSLAVDFGGVRVFPEKEEPLAGRAEGAAPEGMLARLARRVAMTFPDPKEEEGFREWSVRYARRRTLLYASALLAAFAVSSIILWSRMRRVAGPDALVTRALLGVLLGCGVLPGALILAAAVPGPAWRALYARGWAHQYAVVAAAVAAEVACVALLGVLPGGRLGSSVDEQAVWWVLVTLANTVPLALVTLRVRFAWALGWLACAAVPFAAACAMMDRASRVVTTSAPFLAMAMAATYDTERERRALWRESVAAVAAGRAAGGLLVRAHAHEP